MNSVVESGFRNEGRDNMPALLFNSLDFFFLTDNDNINLSSYEKASSWPIFEIGELGFSWKFIRRFHNVHP